MGHLLLADLRRTAPFRALAVEVLIGIDGAGSRAPGSRARGPWPRQDPGPGIRIPASRIRIPAGEVWHESQRRVKNRVLRRLKSRHPIFVCRAATEVHPAVRELAAACK